MCYLKKNVTLAAASGKAVAHAIRREHSATPSSPPRVATFYHPAPQPPHPLPTYPRGRTVTPALPPPVPFIAKKTIPRSGTTTQSKAELRKRRGDARAARHGTGQTLGAPAGAADPAGRARARSAALVARLDSVGPDPARRPWRAGTAVPPLPLARAAASRTIRTDFRGAVKLGAGIVFS
jgi:hypothetical protein